MCLLPLCNQPALPSTQPQAVFHHQHTACPVAGARRLLLGGGGGATGPMLDLQGMQVAWEDEESDVLLLRVDNGIPAGEMGGDCCW